MLLMKNEEFSAGSDGARRPGGCATQYKDLPVRDGTITDSRQSPRKVFKPSAGGAAAGAAVGGVAGNQIGKGNGKKVATALGILAGVAAGAAAAGTEEMVPYSQVAFRDDALARFSVVLSTANGKSA